MSAIILVIVIFFANGQVQTGSTSVESEAKCVEMGQSLTRELKDKSSVANASWMCLRASLPAEPKV